MERNSLISERYLLRGAPNARDLGGRLGVMAPGDWTGAITAALAESLGPDAVWLNPTDLLPEAGAVQAGSPAAVAGMQPGDRFLSINGVAVHAWGDIPDLVQAGGGAPLTVTVLPVASAWLSPA